MWKIYRDRNKVLITQTPNSNAIWKDTNFLLLSTALTFVFSVINYSFWLSEGWTVAPGAQKGIVGADESCHLSLSWPFSVSVITLAQKLMLWKFRLRRNSNLSTAWLVNSPRAQKCLCACLVIVMKVVGI